MGVEICCTHCKAPRTALYRKVEHTETGKLEVIACRLCGQWVASREVHPVELRRGVKTRTAPELPFYQNQVPCRIPGCPNTYMPSMGKSVLEICSAHRQSLHNWSAGKRTRKAPLLRVNGFWFRRDDLLIPADPGSLPAPAVQVEEEKPSSTPSPKPRTPRAPRVSTRIPTLGGGSAGLEIMAQLATLASRGSGRAGALLRQLKGGEL